MKKRHRFKNRYQKIKKLYVNKWASLKLFVEKVAKQQVRITLLLSVNFDFSDAHFFDGIAEFMCDMVSIVILLDTVEVLI